MWLKFTLVCSYFKTYARLGVALRNIPANHMPTPLRLMMGRGNVHEYMSNGAETRQKKEWLRRLSSHQVPWPSPVSLSPKALLFCLWSSRSFPLLKEAGSSLVCSKHCLSFAECSEFSAASKVQLSAVSLCLAGKDYHLPAQGCISPVSEKLNFCK